MNLAFITKRYDTVGGTERDLFELARRLAARGHAVHVYCYDARIPPGPGIVLHHVPITGWGRTANLRGLARRGPDQAFRGQHDLVISYARVLRQDIVRSEGGTHRDFLARIAVRESGLKRWIRRCDPYHRALLAIEAEQFQPGHYRRILAISRKVKEDLVRAYAVPKAQIDVVYSGIDTERFHPGLAAAHRAAIRSRYGIPPDAFVALFVGNAFKRKGLDLLLGAAAALSNPAVHVLVVGTDPQIRSYQRKTAAAGLEHRAHFAGVQREPEFFYAAADVFVLPALHEAFGNVILEAMSCGLPVIVSRDAGAAEVVTGNLAGFTLSDAQDEAELKSLLERLADPAVRAGAGRESRRAAEAFSLDQHADRMERHFREVAARRGD